MRTSIHVVENHADLRAEIVAALQRENFDCEGVSNGSAALLKIREHDYGYILVDVDEPTAATALYESCAANGTLNRIVLITEADDLRDMPESASACSHLRKPFDTKELLARIAR